jgi:hypothetical protein
VFQRSLLFSLETLNYPIATFGGEIIMRRHTPLTVTATISGTVAL